MKFVSYLQNNQEKLGLFHNERIYDLRKTAAKFNVVLPDNMLEFLWGGERNIELSRNINDHLDR